MNITDIKLKYAAAGASTIVKTAADMTRLQTTLASGSGEATVIGAGPYYEVKIEDGGTVYTVNVPALTLNFASTGLYNIGVNKVSAIAKELLGKYNETSPRTFNLANYQRERVNELNAEVTTERNSATPDKKKIKKLRKEINRVEKLKEKDISKILETQITGLETQVNAGVDIEATMTARQIERTLTDYLKKNVMTLEEKKVQKKNNPKKSKLQIFSGMWNFAKKHKKGIGALVLAGTLAGTGIATKGFGLFDGKDNSSNKQQIVTTIPNGTSINSPEFTAAFSANMTRFAAYKDSLELSSGYSYEEIVRGYTFIEHCGSIDTDSMERDQMVTLMSCGDIMIAHLIANGQYGNVSPEARNAMNGGIEQCVTYIQNNNAITGAPLLDYMTVSRKAEMTMVQAVSNNQATSEELSELNSQIINPGYQIYLTYMENGINLGASLNNQKTLGTHPATRA